MSKSVVRPIKKDEGSLAVEDEDIFHEMKTRYGKESIDVKDYDEESGIDL